MGFIKRVFRDSQPTIIEQDTEVLSDPAAEAAASSPAGMRREMLRMALRDTLVRHGIPPHWIGAEMVVDQAEGAERGMHLRLLIKHDEPRLLAHGFALQHSLFKRIELFDPGTSQWLRGISWQFAVTKPESELVMPDPALWGQTRAG